MKSYKSGLDHWKKNRNVPKMLDHDCQIRGDTFLLRLISSGECGQENGAKGNAQAGRTNEPAVIQKRENLK
jgi:hypothetical protein